MFYGNSSAGVDIDDANSSLSLNIVAPKATLIWAKGGLGGRGILWQRPSNNIEIV
jgi:hypothetical protein